jgi:hypothetical protein
LNGIFLFSSPGQRCETPCCQGSIALRPFKKLRAPPFIIISEKIAALAALKKSILHKAFSDEFQLLL